VIVREVARQDAAQVAFAQDEDVIQALTPDRTDEPFREGVLPRAGGRGQDFGDPHALHALPERGTIGVVTIAQEIGRRGVVREGVHDLLGGPVGRGVLGDVEVDHTPAMVGEHDEDKEHTQAAGTVKKSMATTSRTWLARNVRQVCDGGARRFGISRETVRSATSMPSFLSSPWILGAPHRRFIAAIFLMRAVISALIGGRPTRGRPESLAQCSRKRRCCHRRTVSGDTMTRACLQPAQTLASPTHKRRSVLRSLGRVTVRLYTASW
jgi:hypothetical protein